VNPGVVLAWPGNVSCIPEVFWRPRAARIAQSSAAAPPRASASGLIGIGVRTCTSAARHPHGDDTIAVAVERGWGPVLQVRTALAERGIRAHYRAIARRPAAQRRRGATPITDCCVWHILNRSCYVFTLPTRWGCRREQRLVELIKDSVPCHGSSILAVSYTTAAARALRAQVGQKLGPLYFRQQNASP